jgi:hypothetical protein
MTITLTIHESWGAHHGPLSRLLAQIAALEQPTPWSPPVTRQPGDDDEDLAELLDGIDGTELEPAQAPAASPATPRPPAARPVARPFDGIPTTGKSLYRWCCDRKVLPRANAIGKGFGYPKLVSDWEPGQVAAAYAVLTSAEPVADGRGR